MKESNLVKKGIAHYSNSQDFDFLLFGCPLLIQNLSKSLRRKVHNRWTYTCINSLVVDFRHTLESLGIDQFRLIDLALMLHTDYFKGVKGIGPKTALKFITEYLRIENIKLTKQEEFDFSHVSQDLILIHHELDFYVTPMLLG